MNTKWVRRGIAAAAVVAVGLGVAQWAGAQRTKRQTDASPAAQVVQRIGLYDVKVTYARPGVKGREVWNTNLVPYNGKPTPWRAGANENTTFEFESNVKIEGKALPAGKYGFHIIPTETTWTLIFSKDNAAWGSFRYKAENDVLRVDVTPGEGPMQEWLVYGFDNLADTSATAYLAWEKKKITFKIELDVAQ